MGFQYVHDPRATEVERKLDEIKKNNDSTFISDQINNITVPKPAERLKGDITPTKDFINAYNKRKVKEHEEQKNKDFLESIDDQGFKIEKLYNNPFYKKIHDPLNLQGSMQNNDKLAWKVYYNVDPTNLYLRLLYYPELRSEDYYRLIGLFKEQNYKAALLNFFKWGSTFGVAGLMYYLCNILKFKSKTKAFLTFGISFCAYSQFRKFPPKIINSRLNSKALDIAHKYPAVKTEQIIFGQVNV